MIVQIFLTYIIQSNTDIVQSTAVIFENSKYQDKWCFNLFKKIKNTFVFFNTLDCKFQDSKLYHREM